MTRSVALAGLLALALATNARASLIITVQSVTAAAGSNGNAFDVTLTNTGPSSVTVGSFTINLVAPASAPIAFTAVNISTASAPYIFAGHSTSGPNIAIGLTATTL